MSTFETTMKAVRVTAEHWVETCQVPVPSPSNGEVLIKIEKAGVNPTDWKHAKLISEQGALSGCDYAGTVQEVSPHGITKDLKVGDRLGGFLHGGISKTQGAFAQYVCVDSDTTFRIPENVTYSEAATLGVPFFTATQALYRRLGLPEPSKPPTRAYPVLIWSGATSVGQYAIQLCKLSGLSVIATANPKNHEYLKSIGADVCYDYKEEDVSKKIDEAAHHDLAYAFDCISSDESMEACAKSMGRKGGKVCVLQRKDQYPGQSKEVEFIYTLLYTALGKEFDIRGTKFEASRGDREFHERWLGIVSEMMAGGKLKFLKTEERGGLENVGSTLQDLMDGKNSATKYLITP